MSDTSARQGEQTTSASDGKEQKREARYRAARRKFNEATTIGDVQVFFRAWQSWLIWPDRKMVAPVSRVYIGDSLGNVVFNRSLVLSTMADLISDLTQVIQSDVKDITEMSGYKLSLPGERTEMLVTLREAREGISQILDTLEKNDLIRGTSDVEEETSAKPDNEAPAS